MNLSFEQKSSDIIAKFSTGEEVKFESGLLGGYGGVSRIIYYGAFLSQRLVVCSVTGFGFGGLCVNVATNTNHVQRLGTLWETACNEASQRTAQLFPGNTDEAVAAAAKLLHGTEDLARQLQNWSASA